MLGVGQDITDRKQAELEMTRMAKELQTFVDTANAPIFGIDAYGLLGSALRATTTMTTMRPLWTGRGQPRASTNLAA